MFSSPAKRRRSNSSSAIPVDASNTSPRPPNYDTPSQIPTRASFKSPTRASLARSHPDILSRVLNRSPARTARENGYDSSRTVEGNSFGLRRQKPRKSSLPATTDIPPRLSKPSHQTTESPNRASSVPLQVFSAPPRRLSQRLRASESATPAAELLDRRVSTRETGVDGRNGQLVSELKDATKASGSNEVPTDSVSSDNGYGEPDLPPTPTELGLEKPPSRPRGLLSSSPGWRQYKKKIRKFGEGKGLSPLKSKGVGVNGEKDGIRSRSPAIGPAEEKIPDAVQEKQDLRNQLATQLRRLKDDIARLEDETRRSERPNEYPEPSEEATRNLMCAPY